MPWSELTALTMRYAFHFQPCFQMRQSPFELVTWKIASQPINMAAQMAPFVWNGVRTTGILRFQRFTCLKVRTGYLRSKIIWDEMNKRRRWWHLPGIN